MSTSLHDSLMAELQRGGASQETDTATQAEVNTPLDLEYVEKLAADVEALVGNEEEVETAGEPAEESPVDVHAILQNRLSQVKTASAQKPEDAAQARTDLLRKLAQVVPGVKVEPTEEAGDTSEQARAVLSDWLEEASAAEKVASGISNRTVADLVGGIR